MVSCIGANTSATDRDYTNSFINAFELFARICCCFSQEIFESFQLLPSDIFHIRCATLVSTSTKYSFDSIIYFVDFFGHYIKTRAGWNTSFDFYYAIILKLCFVFPVSAWLLLCWMFSETFLVFWIPLCFRGTYMLTNSEWRKCSAQKALHQDDR